MDPAFAGQDAWIGCRRYLPSSQRVPRLSIRPVRKSITRQIVRPIRSLAFSKLFHRVIQE
jgi:hypothetical protein